MLFGPFAWIQAFFRGLFTRAVTAVQNARALAPERMPYLRPILFRGSVKEKDRRRGGKSHFAPRLANGGVASSLREASSRRSHNRPCLCNCSGPCIRCRPSCIRLGLYSHSCLY